MSKKELIKEITRRGHKYSENIEKATHLITNTPFYITPKITHAMQRGLPVIHDSYFEDTKHLEKF